MGDVDWQQLSHAYGPATDVPAMLRALASTDATDRADALDAAYGNIYHQGTRYTATPPAIARIIEIAARPDAKQVDDLLALLVHCVAGQLTPTSGPRHATGPIWGGAVRPMTDYGETLELLAACEDAAEPAVALCLRLVTEAKPAERAAAAWLLAALGKFAERYEVAPRLVARFAVEEEPKVRAAIVLALTHLLPLRERWLEEMFRAEPDALVRLVAAMGLARRGQATPEVSTALVGWLYGDDALAFDQLADAYEASNIGGGDLADDIAALLSTMGPDVLATAMPALVEQLSTADDFGAVGLLQAALAGAFGAAPAPAPSDLTATQRELLTALAHNQLFWMIGNATSLLMQRQLPSLRADMAQLLGVDVVDDPLVARRGSARLMTSFGPERALEAWQEVLALAPDDPEALERTGSILVELDQPEEALPLLQRAVEVAHGVHGARALFGLGAALAAIDDLPNAYEAFTHAEQLLTGDDKVTVRHNHIAILQRLGRTDDALALALEHEPRTAEDFYHLGLAQVKAGHYQACIDSMFRVLGEEPDHGHAHYTLACAHALSGKPELALAAIERAIEADPELAPHIAEDEDFASLQDDPRFRELVDTEVSIDDFFTRPT
ncbi:MAG TPA: tetratricopeptide repeat protein [Kofleriaceae bacterium]|nr:tetratricopeptide repeat protein [Kofleriaceae bacterium]